jgi:hypothetical protein
MFYDTVIAEAVECRSVVDTSWRLRCRTSEELEAYGCLTVAADRTRASLRVKVRVEPGLQRSQPFVDCKFCFKDRTTVKLVQWIPYSNELVCR